MRRHWVVAWAAGWLIAGCAHGTSTATRLALAAAYLCKHCNCYMPAEVDPNAICPVCSCGYVTAHCHRGR